MRKYQVPSTDLAQKGLRKLPCFPFHFLFTKSLAQLNQRTVIENVLCKKLGVSCQGAPSVNETVSLLSRRWQYRDGATRGVRRAQCHRGTLGGSAMSYLPVCPHSRGAVSGLHSNPCMNVRKPHFKQT